MSGVAVISELLRGDAALLTLIASAMEAATGADVAGQIKAGRFSDKVALPALLVRTVSVVERQPLKRGAMVRQTERVSVSVRAKSYREQQAVIRRVRSCCAGEIGDMAGVYRVSVLTAGTGPDGVGPGDSFEQTQDFRVSFDAPA